jgi:hypothetical protein
MLALTTGRRTSMSEEHKIRDEHEAYITVYKSVGGWKAVVMTWHDGDYSPWGTGISSYRTRKEAEAEARDWAASEGVALRL